MLKSFRFEHILLPAIYLTIAAVAPPSSISFASDDDVKDKKPAELNYEMIKESLGRDHLSTPNFAIHEALDSMTKKPISIYHDDPSNPIAFTHVWKDKGFQAMFDKDNILQYVSLHTAYDSNFKPFPFALPAKLKPTDNRDSIEKNLGKPDKTTDRDKLGFYELSFKKLGLTIQMCHDKKSNADVIRSIKIYLPQN